jgi:hypothetical protein
MSNHARVFRSQVVHSFSEPASLPVNGEPLTIIFDREPPIIERGWNAAQQESALYRREARMLAMTLSQRIPWLLFSALAESLVVRRQEIMDEAEASTTD